MGGHWKRVSCQGNRNFFIARGVFPVALLRLVFTSDGVVVGVVIRRVERYDLVKTKPTESEAEH